MAKEIHSGRTGDTSRTKKENIKNNSIRLFGVEITENNVSSCGKESESTSAAMEGRNLLMNSSSKGRRWSEDEQRAFLIGLKKLGKGNWVGIARDFVPSRTPTQVASHAQKYFDRQKDNNKRAPKRHNCSSVFDINLDQESSRNTCPSPTNQSFIKKSNSKGKETTPISPMPVSYRVPPNASLPWVSFNGSYVYAYVPMPNYYHFAKVCAPSSTNATSSQSNSASLDNLDLTL
ncbi:hypothetical protein HAX54_019590 [Datura stramonium]|uniref:Uncharacterized protein n=1 Tax=Datura stramonium TaxID=4076 RepID=A0ABS8URU0_DATST|nr:hypothetical protein [Datura stramonium]